MVKILEKYFEGVGRRKTSVARVRVSANGDSKFTVNDKAPKLYFNAVRYENSAIGGLKYVKGDKLTVSVKVNGGGLMSQSEAIKLGLARALVKWSPELRGELKAAGFLTRIAKVVERKKFGLKKARKGPQWNKR